MVITKSPSGALSPYYYKGGYFHGIHYGSYFDDMDSLLSMMRAEEDFIFHSPEKRRIAIDLYETDLTPSALKEFVSHIDRINERIIKLAVVSDKRALRAIRKALSNGCSLNKGQLYFTTDMEEGKTWLVSDNFLS